MLKLKKNEETFTAKFRCFPLQVGHVIRTSGKANYLLFLTWVLYRGSYLSKCKTIHSLFVVSTTLFVLPEIVLKVVNKITATYLQIQLSKYVNVKSCKTIFIKLIFPSRELVENGTGADKARKCF